MPHVASRRPGTSNAVPVVLRRHIACQLPSIVCFVSSVTTIDYLPAQAGDYPNDVSEMSDLQNQSASPEDRILVFIPAYNCAPQIGRVLNRFTAVPAGLFAEILVVDNRSTDRTADAALQASADLPQLPITVVRNHSNYGLGGSHKAAFRYAADNGFTHVIVLHGDDQGRIADVLPVLAQGLHRRMDCCLGSRFSRRSRLQGYALTRRLGNYVFNALFTLVSGRLVTDLGSGLNIFNRRAFTDPAITFYSDDLRFNCYFLLGLVASRKSFLYFPIHWSEEDQVSNVKIVSQSLNTLRILMQYLFSRGQFRTSDHRATAHPAYTFDILSERLPEAIGEPEFAALLEAVQ